MFSDADLLGIPLRLVISPKTLEAGQVEFKRRNSRDSELISVTDAAAAVAAKVKEELAKFDI
jgi:prolyl-tRNA synthetase